MNRKISKNYKLMNIYDIKGDTSNDPLIYTSYFDNENDINLNDMYQIQGIKNTSKCKIVNVGATDDDKKILLDTFQYSKKVEIKIISYLYVKETLISNNKTFPLVLIHVFKVKDNIKKNHKLKEICSIGIFFTFNNKIEILDEREYDGEFTIEYYSDKELKQIDKINSFPGNNNIEKIITYIITSSLFKKILNFHNLN
jgi:hypothetical protein